MRVEWKIFHITSSIRRSERLLTWDGYATPHTSEHPAVAAARTADQLARIAELRTRLALWEANQADQATTALSNWGDTNMTDCISTKDTAKLVRVALKNALAGVKFSVRMSTGTASAWMNVSWSDGPTDREASGELSAYASWAARSARSDETLAGPVRVTSP